MSNKVHAIGTRLIGTKRTTACNTYMADGGYAVTTSTDHADVTCLACLKAIRKTAK